MTLHARTRTTYGGNRARVGGGGRVYNGAPAEGRTARTVLVRTPTDSPGTRRCPSCHEAVPTRPDGSLPSHRVGPDRRRSWPCPGDDPAPRN